MPAPVTPLRQSQRRTRALSIDEHLRECVDQLQHPELLGEELRTSFAEIQSLLQSSDAAPARRAARSGEPAEIDRAAAFYPSREIFVVRDSSSFTCLATHVDPPLGGLDDDSGNTAEDASEEAHAGDVEGFDYLALTCTASPRPVLGVVQSEHDQSAYPLLLRHLANLCELAHPRQLDRYDREHFRGLLGSVPLVDLHIVLFDTWSDPEAAIERTPISQLTRDLAERVKDIVAAERSIPPILGDIVCLQMNPERFDGRVRFDWRV